MRIIYPYPMNLSNGYTYMLSITQFLNSLAEIVTVDLLCLDSKEQFTYYLEETLGLKLNTNLNIMQISNKKFGIKSNRLFFSKNAAKYINNLDKDEIKIIYTRDLKQMKELLKLKSNFKNTKFIFESHQILSQNLCKEGKYKNAKTIRLLENNVFDNVDSLVCISKTLSNEIKKSFLNCVEKHLILPVGFNKDFISHQKEDTIYDVIYTGSFVSWKGVDVLINALKIVNEKQKIKVILIGASDKEYTKYTSIIKGLQLENCIEVKRKINHKEIINYLCKAKIGVLPNVYEDDSLLFTSPLKLYEYLGVGLKIVCSRLPSIESSVDNELIYWARSEDENSLAQQIIKALNDTSCNADKLKEYSKSFIWEQRAINLIEYIKSETND